MLQSSEPSGEQVLALKFIVKPHSQLRNSSLFWAKSMEISKPENTEEFQIFKVLLRRDLDDLKHQFPHDEYFTGDRWKFL